MRIDSPNFKFASTILAFVAVVLVAGCEPTIPTASEPSVTSKPLENLDDLLDSCDAGQPSACRKACDRNTPEACYSLALMHEDGRGGLSVNERRAAHLFGEACKGGVEDGCEEEARLDGIIASKRAADKEKRKAAADEKRREDLAAFGPRPKGAKALGKYNECREGDVESCTTLGHWYRTGKEGLVGNHALALSLHQRSCNGGSARGCNNLGFMYASGLGGLKKDDARAARLYRESCDRGDALACRGIADSYARGLGVTKDEARAARLYRKSCDGGDNGGCEALKTVEAKIPSKNIAKKSTRSEAEKQAAYDAIKAISGGDTPAIKKLKEQIRNAQNECRILKSSIDKLRKTSKAKDREISKINEKIRVKEYHLNIQVQSIELDRKAFRRERNTEYKNNLIDNYNRELEKGRKMERELDRIIDRQNDMVEDADSITDELNNKVDEFNKSCVSK